MFWMTWLTWLIVSLVAWWGMNAWMKTNSGFGGWWASLLASLVGGWLGDWTLGDWGWMMADYNVIAGLLGAGVLTSLWKLAKSKV